MTWHSSFRWRRQLPLLRTREAWSSSMNISRSPTYCAKYGNSNKLPTLRFIAAESNQVQDACLPACWGWGLKSCVTDHLRCRPCASCCPVRSTMFCLILTMSTHTLPFSRHLLWYFTSKSKNKIGLSRVQSTQFWWLPFTWILSLFEYNAQLAVLTALVRLWPLLIHVDLC